MYTLIYYNVSQNTNNPGHIGWTMKLQLPSNECWSKTMVWIINAAERAIRTFKNRFVARLCSTHLDFPLHLWDSLLPQKQKSLSTCCRRCKLNPTCLHTRHSLVHMITIDTHSCPQAPKWSSMKNQAIEEVGTAMENLVGTLVPRSNTIAATSAM
jgi:hypothetical protein